MKEINIKYFDKEIDKLEYVGEIDSGRRICKC